MCALANQDAAESPALAAFDARVIAGRLRGFAVAADFITGRAEIEQGLDEGIAGALAALHDQMTASATELEELLDRLSVQLRAKA